MREFFRIKRMLAIMVLSLIVTACASTPVVTSPGKVNVEYTRNFPGGGTLKEVPTEVTIVKRKNTAMNVAAQVGLNVISLFAGGGAGSNTFNKDDLKGDKIEDLTRVFGVSVKINLVCITFHSTSFYTDPKYYFSVLSGSASQS